MDSLLFFDHVMRKISELWSRWWGSNPLPTVYDTVALPGELQRRTKISFIVTVVSFVVTAALWPAPNQLSAKGIFNVPRKESKPSVSLSQDLSLVFDQLPLSKQVYVEHLEESNFFTLTILPRALTLAFELVDSSPNHAQRRLYSADNAPLMIAHETSSATHYALSAGTLKLFFGPPRETEVHLKPLETATVNVESHTLRFTNAHATQPADFSITPSSTKGAQNNTTTLFHLKTLHPTTTPISLRIQMPYTDSGGYAKKIVAFNATTRSWDTVPDYHNIENKFVETEITMMPASIALDTNTAAHDGIASWYSFKNCLCAASRVYPKGTKLEVMRLKTGKRVIVTVNDYGPEEWTGRVIDLDKRAFAEIGSIRAGLIYVRVSPVYDTTDKHP